MLAAATGRERALRHRDVIVRNQISSAIERGELAVAFHPVHWPPSPGLLEELRAQGYKIRDEQYKIVVRWDI